MTIICVLLNNINVFIKMVLTILESIKNNKIYYIIYHINYIMLFYYKL